MAMRIRFLWMLAVLSLFSTLHAGAQSQPQNPPQPAPQQNPQPSSARPQQKQASSKESVADAARRAREEKKSVPKASRVFDNDSLPPAGGGINIVGNENPQGEADKNVANPADAKKAATSEKPAAKADENSEKAWRAQFAKAHERLRRDQSDLEVMQREVNQLQTQYYSDPQKAMQQQYSRGDIAAKQAKIAAKQKEVEADRQALNDLQDALRKAGGDPGWASQ